MESFVDALNANQIMFIVSCIQDWLKAQEITMLYIKPGSLGRTGILRAFTTSFARNLPNHELFGNPARGARYTGKLACGIQ
jgi:hypothetical protein